MSMIQIITEKDTQRTAFIHRQGMPNDFLPSFGILFLKLLHERLLVSQYIIPLGYYKGGILHGFVMGTTNTKKALKETMLKNITLFLPFVIKKLITSPKTIKYLLETALYGNGDNQYSAEILIFSIEKEYRRKGVGNKLIKTLKNELRKKNISNLKVGTLSTNKAANNFYKKNGGKFHHTFKIYSHLWNVYHFKI